MFHNAARGVWAWAAVACVVGATLCGCATTYHPTERRSQEAEGLRAEVTEVGGTLREVTLSLETSGPQRIESIRLAGEEQAPCTAESRLEVVDAISGQVIELPQDLDGGALVKVALSANAAMIPTLNVDIEAPVPSEAAADHAPAARPRCLRLPLTRPDRVLWRARAPVWGMGASFRVDVPTGGTLGGVGAGASAEVRWARPMGPVRLMVAATFGAAGCRADCPEVDLASTDDGDLNVVGIFGHMGLALGIEHRVPLGRWGLELAGGGSSSFAVLQVPAGFEGNRLAVLVGPFVACGSPSRNAVSSPDSLPP